MLPNKTIPMNIDYSDYSGSSSSPEDDDEILFEDEVVEAHDLRHGHVLVLQDLVRSDNFLQDDKMDDKSIAHNTPPSMNGEPICPPASGDMEELQYLEIPPEPRGLVWPSQVDIEEQIDIIGQTFDTVMLISSPENQAFASQ